MVYDSDTSRPVVNESRAAWQDGRRMEAVRQSRWQRTNPRPRANTDVARKAVRRQLTTSDRWRGTDYTAIYYGSRFQDGLRQHRDVVDGYDDSLRRRTSAKGRYQEALPIRQSAGFVYQDALRLRNTADPRFTEAVRLQRGWFLRVGSGLARIVGRDARYQDAKRPDPGETDFTIPPPPPNLCYVPSPNLLFAELAALDGNLVFMCDGHSVGPEPPPGETIVVPIRRVYVTINSATLIRVDTGAVIPTFSFSLSLDVDSWTWSFSASVPGSAFDLVSNNTYGDPVEVQATINNVPYRLVVEGVSRERVFGRSSLRVTGRGRNAQLDAPYAPVLDFGASGSRTLEQLLNDVLVDNGVPLGWTVDLELDDWTIPGGVWSHQGTYMSALNTLAAAGGGYIQPHRTAQSVFVKARYPVPSWEFDTVVPDYSLPAAVTTREGIEWVDRPRYNRVFVSGQQSGVLGRYTRAGTAGDLLAPGVVDPLITAAAAVRQRGRSILSAGGRVATVSLRLPVLSETGIISPGKFVQYNDGGITRLGLTRSVQVDVQMPTIYQTIQVETHVN